MIDADYGFRRRGATKNRGLGTMDVPPEHDEDEDSSGNDKPELFDIKAWAIEKWSFVPICVGPHGTPRREEPDRE